MKTRLSALLLTLALFLGAPKPSHAQIPVTDVLHIGVTTWAEIARYGQAAFQIYQQALQVYNEYTMIQHQIDALKKLGGHHWRDIGPLYHQIVGLFGQTESLVYTLDTLDDEFSATFPGASSYVSYSADSLSQVQRTLATLRLNLLALHQIHNADQGSLQDLGIIQQHVDASEGHEQALESLAELASWQADQAATTGSTLKSIANAIIVSNSYEISRAAQIQETNSETLIATEAEAFRASQQQSIAYSILPPWVPQQ
jgi:P-type conjugative transfer protein TrbJ